MPVTLSLRTNEVRTSVTLPLSKSIWNRALMVNAYAGVSISKLQFPFLRPDDVKKMYEAIEAVEMGQTTIDSGDAGTVARFALTLLTMTPGKHILTGSQRMLQRPIGPLVDALRLLGATIEYAGNQGFLPIIVEGHPMQGGELSLHSTMSSQYASSLLLAAPMWPNGLVLHLPDNMPSLPYADMTLAVMRHYGAIVNREDDTIIVQPQPYAIKEDCHLPADWSAASYWYEIAALSTGCDVMLQGLGSEVEGFEEDVMQGDSVVTQLFQDLGVVTRFESDGVRLLKNSQTTICRQQPADLLHFDVSKCPDLFPSLFVACVALNRPVIFSGIKNLALKESNRVESLITELSKYYTFINIVSDDEIKIDNITEKCYINPQNRPIFETYNDHRIAMALAPLIFRFKELQINHPEVVEKSYPNYWSDIQCFVSLFT